MSAPGEKGVGPPPPRPLPLLAIAAVGVVAAAGAALAPAAAPALAALGGVALGLLAAVALRAERVGSSPSGLAAGGQAATGPAPRPGEPDRDREPTAAPPAPGARETTPAVARSAAPRPLVIDTSALIDGRLGALLAAGVIEGAVLVPRAVALELQRLSGSQDKLKRERGQRGLDLLEALRAEPQTRAGGGRSGEANAGGGAAGVEIVPGDTAEGAVDEAVLALARARGGRVVTTDGPLARLARLEGLPAFHLHEAALALRSRAQQGERPTVKVIRPGDGPGQGLGYLEDGSPVVIEGARERVGDSLAVEVTSVRRSKSGAVYFARIVTDG